MNARVNVKIIPQFGSRYLLIIMILRYERYVRFKSCIQIMDIME